MEFPVPDANAGSSAASPAPQADSLVGPATPFETLPPSFEDRSTGLVIFGILEIVGAVVILLFIPLMLLGALIQRKSGMAAPVASLLSVCASYGTLAIVLLTLGIGAAQAKRWAWALNLILSWVWLIFGVLATIAAVFLLPRTFLSAMREAASRTPNAPPMPTTFMAVMLTFMIVLLAVVAVILPIAFLLFYRSKNVELTCKHRDPVERWTDRVPLPVLAYALLTAFGALFSVLAVFARPLFPFFGRYLTGVPAGILLFGFAVVDAVIAVSFYRLKLAGWWLAVVTLGLRLVSTILTAARGDLLQAYARLGWSQKRIQILAASPMFQGGGILWWTGIFFLISFGFLLWLKRYFRAADPPSYTLSSPVADQIATGN